MSMDWARPSAEVTSRMLGTGHNLIKILTNKFRSIEAANDATRDDQARNGQEDLSSDHFLFMRGWFDEHYRGQLGERFYTTKMALNWLLQREGTNIVETGSLREPGNWFGVGCATSLFGYFASMYGGHLWTCDISEEVIETAQRQTTRFRDNITYVCNDSVAFLNTFEGTIDLFYLDSMDCPPTGDATEAQQHNRRELQAALPKLSERALVLLDDNQFRNGGKTPFSKQYLLDNGWICLFDWHQSLWTRRCCHSYWNRGEIGVATAPPLPSSVI
jgi:hypothetical protein